MSDKHPNAGVEAAIEVVEGHRKLFEGDSKREALCTSILSCLRALPAQQPDVSELVEALEGIEPYLDQLVCYASTTQEHKPNAVVKRVRDALQSQRQPEPLPSIEGAHGGQKAEA